jgi:pimeloyl-ACP methyl ester carboxylesterase
MERSRKNRSRSTDLVCPSCGRTHPANERFCVDCGMPLVQTGEYEPLTPERERARKIDPRYTQGELVRVGFANHQAEAELLQSILLDEGIPSMTKRSIDVPDFLAAGPRDIYVPASAAEFARALLSSAAGGGAA